MFLSNMQGNPFKMMIYILLTVMAHSFIWTPVSASNSTQGKIDWDEQQKKDDKVLKEIDMLCRGKILLPANVQKQLKCRYSDNGNPFLKIAPFKEEEAYLEPRIVIFHDVIYDEEIEILKKLSQPEIKLVDVETYDERFQLGRIGQIAWLKKEKHEIVNMLNRRIGHITGLNVANAEPVQVCYYGIGGMFLPHFDFLRPTIPKIMEIGNRIATLMYYLNDVQEGGRTVFNKLNVTLTPKKGSAVFWYNLLPNGMGNPLTLHAGCPVISGIKWVANVWLHELGQEFLRPCSLENQPGFVWD